MCCLSRSRGVVLGISKPGWVAGSVNTTASRDAVGDRNEVAQAASCVSRRQNEKGRLGVHVKSYACAVSYQMVVLKEHAQSAMDPPGLAHSAKRLTRQRTAALPFGDARDRRSHAEGSKCTCGSRH